MASYTCIATRLFDSHAGGSTCRGGETNHWLLLLHITFLLVSAAHHLGGGVGSINVITSYHAMQHHNNPHLTAAKTAPDNLWQVKVHNKQ